MDLNELMELDDSSKIWHLLGTKGSSVCMSRLVYIQSQEQPGPECSGLTEVAVVRQHLE
jgi:hypothetical protein